MFGRLFAEFADELAANILLHRFLRRSHPARCRGPALHELPELYSGRLETFYAPEVAPANLETGRQRLGETDAGRVSDIQFRSDLQTAWPESDLVWCRHWQSPGEGTGLTVVGIDGVVQLGNRWFRRLATQLTPHGIDVLAVDTPGNFRRTPTGFRPGQLIMGGDLAHQLAVTRQAVRDVAAVIAALQAQGRRVGLVGVSYGGWMALLTSLIAPRCEFVVALIPPVDLVRMLRQGGTIVRGIRRGLGHEPLDPEELARIASPVIPSRWPAPLAGERILLHAAQYDRLVPSAGITRLAELWGAQLFAHPTAHFRFALNPRTQVLIAGQVRELWRCSMPNVEISMSKE